MVELAVYLSLKLELHGCDTSCSARFQSENFFTLIIFKIEHNGGIFHLAGWLEHTITFKRSNQMTLKLACGNIYIFPLE